MNSWRPLAAIAIVFALIVGSSSVKAQNGHDEHGNGKPNDKKKVKKPELPKCPVMGDPVDFSIKTMTKDGPVYFCCKMCINTYTTKPEKYTKEVIAQRAALAKLPKIQVTCPVAGKTIDKKVFIGTGDKKVYFCCKDCVEKYKKDATKYKAKLSDSYSYQTKCPVMGGKIDPKAFVTLPTGQKVFFCCKGCDTKFLKDPAKYVDTLKAQGTKIDPKKIKAGEKKTEDKSHKHDGHDGHDH